MNMDKLRVGMPRQCGLEEALDLTGFGKYNVAMLISCCLIILSMYLDMLGLSVPLPVVACDLSLTTSQQGLLSATPLIGVMISSYAWGLCADSIGRRKTILMAMPVGLFFNMVTSFAPSFASLTALKFLSACFTSSANAAAFVLMGESVSRQYRSRCMYLMASTTMANQLVVSAIAISVLSLNFRPFVPWLEIEYRPWRLLLLLISLPGLLGTLGVALLYESPKFLLSKNREDQALKVLIHIYNRNTNGSRDGLNVENIYLDDCISSVRMQDNIETSFIRRMWNQTVPLFKPPLLKNSCIIYYLLLCAFVTSTGYTAWVPTMTNAYFSNDDNTGKSFCEVASSVARPRNSKTSFNCDNAISSLTLYAVMIYSGLAVLLNVLLLFVVKPLGKKGTTLLVFVFCIICGILLVFVRIPLLSIAMFYLFLYVALILGNANTYLVDLNPTHLRGMATCLSVVVARGFGFISVQLIATFLVDHCTPMLIGYVGLVISGFIVAFLLPPDAKKPKSSNSE